MKIAANLTFCICLLVISSTAMADDLLTPPAPTTTDHAPSFTFPPPMGSSLGNGMIINGSTQPPVIHGNSVPIVEYESAPGAQHRVMGTTPTAPLGSHSTRRPARRSSHHTIDQFQSSSYWNPPQPFNPGGAPDYGMGLAGAGGTHIRYPYFKYRAPWTYQGPHGISHTIEW